MIIIIIITNICLLAKYTYHRLHVLQQGTECLDKENFKSSFHFKVSDTSSDKKKNC